MPSQDTFCSPSPLKWLVPSSSRALHLLRARLSWSGCERVETQTQTRCRDRSCRELGPLSVRQIPVTSLVAIISHRLSQSPWSIGQTRTLECAEEKCVKWIWKNGWSDDLELKLRSDVTPGTLICDTRLDNAQYHILHIPTNNLLIENNRLCLKQFLHNI